MENIGLDCRTHLDGEFQFRCATQQAMSVNKTGVSATNLYVVGNTISNDISTNTLKSNSALINNVSGNIQTGISLVQLDVSKSGVAGTYVVQAIDISGDVLNSDVTVSNANVLVRINNHFYKAATSGL
jgi:hypothetical protein